MANTYDKLMEILPVFMDEIPENLEHGKCYISKMHEVAVHLCACGCGKKAVMPLNQQPIGGYVGWKLTEQNNMVSFTPSVGNFSWERPSYHAHYFITNNKIQWC